MRLYARSKRRSRTAPARLALVLLLLFAHAYFVGATHGFRVVLRGEASISTDAALGARPAHLSADSNGHAECLLCRLQRNLLAELDSPTVSFVAPQRAVACADTILQPLQSNEPFNLPAGRAPPRI